MNSGQNGRGTDKRIVSAEDTEGSKLIIEQFGELCL